MQLTNPVTRTALSELRLVELHIHPIAGEQLMRVTFAARTAAGEIKTDTVTVRDGRSQGLTPIGESIGLASLVSTPSGYTSCLAALGLTAASIRALEGQIITLGLLPGGTP